jgi:hypothetical protein
VTLSVKNRARVNLESELFSVLPVAEEARWRVSALGMVDSIVSIFMEELSTRVLR